MPNLRALRVSPLLFYTLSRTPNVKFTFLSNLPSFGINICTAGTVSGTIIGTADLKTLHLLWHSFLCKYNDSL